MLLLASLPKSILPHIKAQIGPATFREIYIKKVITETLLGITVLINDRQSRPCYQIQPRTAYRDIKRGAILNNRPL